MPVYAFTMYQAYKIDKSIDIWYIVINES